MKYNRTRMLVFFCALMAIAGLTGCYPVHSIEKYPAKAEYYKDANSAFEDEEVKVSLTQSDSVFYAEDAMIQNDSISLTTIKKWESRTLDWKDVVSTAYYYKDYDNLCALFKLKSGASINAEYVKINPDSSIECKVFNMKTITLPLAAIKNIRYKNYWGIPAGFILGTGSGILTGVILYNYETNKHRGQSSGVSGFGRHEEDPLYGVVPTLLGPIIGTAVGWIIGGRTTWEFNK